jgi:general secretion pathway protein G
MMGQRENSERGFSLIELIVVLVILGLLAAVVGPKIFGKFFQAKREIARIQISEFEGALNLYNFQIGRYPTTSEGLEALIRNPGNIQSWNGPYLKKEVVPEDPWHRPYVYRSPGQHGEYDLFSYGPDGVEGGEGENTDIVSWQ